MSKRIGAVPTAVLAAIVLWLAAATSARAQTTLLDVQTGAGDTVATVRSDTMRLNVPLRLVPGGFAAEGTYSSSTSVDPPTTGAGSRMMWYPEKAAFRAGMVSSTQWDRANVGNFSTAMGYNTMADGNYAVAMGSSTTASGSFATAMGQSTSASGSRATAMGIGTTASGYASTAMGLNTSASGNYSTATGRSTSASGFITTAMGYYASTNGTTGSFVYGDASTNTYVTAAANHQFVVRASGGTTFYSNSGMTTGSYLPGGSGSWSSVSDVATKTNFEPVDGETVLEKLRRVPILEWSYKAQDASIRHLGPMAQDFHAAFGLGENDTTIPVVDADGVNMLAIQALAERTRALRSDNQALHDTNAALRDELADTRQRLTGAERRLARVEALLERLAASERE